MTARRRPDHPLELRKASCSPSAPAKQKGAHIAPPSDCRAKRAPSPNCARIRATTNPVRIGDPLWRTQIRKQSESNLCTDHGTSLQDWRVVLGPLLSPASSGVKPQRIGRLLNHFGGWFAAPGPSGVKSCAPPPEATCPNAGRGEGTGRKGSRNQRRGASSDSPRERQCPIQFARRRNRVMTPNSLIPA